MDDSRNELVTGEVMYISWEEYREDNKIVREWRLSNKNTQEINKNKSQDEKENKKDKCQEITTPVSKGSFLDQQQNFKSMASFLDSLDLSTVSDRWELEYLLEILEKHWRTITCIDQEFDYTDENYEASYTLHEQMFVNIKKEISNKLWLSRIKSLRDQYDMPIFNGHYPHWASFKEVFTRDIHNNSDFTADEKMMVLIAHIRGEPNRLVQHLSICSENYETCWKILNDHYSNKNLILSTYMNILMNIPEVQIVTPNRIKNVHKVAIYCINGIKDAGINMDNWDPIFVHLLTQKLDPESVKEYQASLENPRELPSLDYFLEFMLGRCVKMESAPMC